MRLLLLTAATIGPLCGAAAANAAPSPAGQFYRMTVTSSFKPAFADCWAFSSNGRFIVSHAGLGSFPYQAKNLNTAAGNWQALWQGRNSIGFSGTASGGSLVGDGVDSYDRTYHMAGTQVSGCAGAATVKGGFATR